MSFKGSSIQMPDGLSQGESQLLTNDTASNMPKPSETLVTDSQSMSPAPTPKPKSSTIISASAGSSHLGSSDSVDDKSSIQLATSTTLPLSQPTPLPLHKISTASRTGPLNSSESTQSAPEAIPSAKSDLAHAGQSRSKLDSGNRPTLTSTGEVTLPSGSSHSQPSHHDSNSGSLQPTTFAFIGAIILVSLLVGFSLWVCCRCRERRDKHGDSKQIYHAQGSDSHSFFDKTPPPGFDAYSGLSPILTREPSRQGRHVDGPNVKAYAPHDSSLWERSEEMGGRGSGQRFSIREEKFEVKSLYQDLDFGPLVTPNGESTPHLLQPHDPQFEAVRRAPSPSATLGVNSLSGGWQSSQALPAGYSTNTNSLYPDYKGVTPLYQLTPQYHNSSSTGNSNKTEERMRHKKDTIVGLAEAYGNANGWGEVELEPMPELRYPYQADTGDIFQAESRFTLQLNERTTLPYASTPTLPLPAYHGNATSISARVIDQPTPHIIYQPYTRFNISSIGGATAFQNVRDQSDPRQSQLQNGVHGQKSETSEAQQQPLTSIAFSKTTGENALQTTEALTFLQSHENTLSDFPVHPVPHAAFKPPHHFARGAFEMQHDYPPIGHIGTLFTGQAVTSADLLSPMQPSPSLIECSVSSPTFLTMNHAFESPVSYRAESSSLAHIFGLTSATRTDHLILGTPCGSAFQPSNPSLGYYHAQNPYQGIIIPEEEAYGTPWQANPTPASNTPGPSIPQEQMTLDTNATHYHSPTLSVYDLYNRAVVPGHVDSEPQPPRLGLSETLR